MTANHVASIREGLGLSVQDMAALLGVSPSTVYRWEAAGDRAIRVDPMQAKILTLLETQPTGAELGKKLATAILVRGGLYGLYKLLEAVFDEEVRAP